jgi:hypothetical protein
MHPQQTIAAIKAAILKKDWAAYGALLAEDVRWHTPLLAAPLTGKALMLQLQSIVLGEVIEDFQYPDVAHGTQFHYLYFTGHIGAVAIEGTDRVVLNERGLVQEFRVDGRPLDGINALGAGVQAALQRHGIAFPV